MNHEPINTMAWNAQCIIDLCRELAKDELNMCGVAKRLEEIQLRVEGISAAVQEVHVE